MMTTISKDQNVITLVSVFTVVPENQDKILNLLIESIDHFISKCNGFISSNLHKSLDGKSVVNYVQWKTVEDFKAMIQSEEGQKMVEGGKRLAESANTNLYVVTDSREI